MNKLHTVLMFMVAALTLWAVSSDEAFAKRLGGGKSFGGRPSFSQPYRGAPDAASPSRTQQPAYQSAARNQPLRDSFRNRGGFMGMLGGLALGGILGAMLFGGAFEHINLFDIIVFGAVVFLLYRFFAARRNSSEWNRSAVGVGSARLADPQTSQRTGARFNTDVLFAGSTKTTEGPPKNFSADFDPVSFLSGAKNAYRHLQHAWDAGDRSELRALCTQAVFDELNEQLQQRVAGSRTQILDLQARLLDVEEDDGVMRASVLFDGLIQEDEGAAPADIREVWHFVRRRDSGQPTWFLDGIQQLDSSV